MIIGFIGGIGQGKTVSAVKYINEEWKKGKRILTNIKLKFNSDKRIENLTSEFFKNYKNSNVEMYNTTILADEIHVYVDSRKSNSPINQTFTRFVTQSRKRSVNLVFTTQDEDPATFRISGQPDLRLRKLVDIIILCEKIKCSNDMVFFKNTFYNHSGNLLGRPLLFFGKDYFDLYDTDEIVDMEEDNIN